MKYKLIGSGDINHLIETILINRGISDPYKYLELDETCCNPYENLNHIMEAVRCFDKHINDRNKISILCDCDPDGYTSASIIYQYIKRLDPDYPVEFIIHGDNKAHGLQNMEDGDFEIPDGTKLFIIPDAGTNDSPQCNKLIRKGMDIIVLDHHEMEEIGRKNKAIIVNNQVSPKYTDKAFSGAGIAYEFCRALDDYYMLDYAPEFLDLVALGNISDSMSVLDYQTRYYINQGLKHINNEFFKALLKKQDVDNLTIHNISWSVTPIINAMVRLGTLEERQLMFKAFVGENEFFPYQKRGSTVEIQEDIWTHMARLCYNIKSRQDRIRDKIYFKLLEEVNKEDKIPIVITDEADAGIVGVSCIKLANALHKPCIVLRKMANGTLAGSARNCNNSPIPLFKDFNNSLGVFNLCAGHQNAHGIVLDATRLEEARIKINKAASDIDFDRIVECDFIVDMENITPEFVGEIYASEWLYGKDLDEPVIVIQNVKLRSDACRLMGKEQDSLSFVCNGIKYCKFKCSPDDELLKLIGEGFNGLKNVNLIGKCSINEYNGIVEPQVIIEDYEIM